jgi:hypothetical protein
MVIMVPLWQFSVDFCDFCSFLHFSQCFARVSLVLPPFYYLLAGLWVCCAALSYQPTATERPTSCFGAPPGNRILHTLLLGGSLRRLRGGFAHAA